VTTEDKCSAYAFSTCFVKAVLVPFIYNIYIYIRLGRVMAQNCCAKCHYCRGMCVECISYYFNGYKKAKIHSAYRFSIFFYFIVFVFVFDAIFYGLGIRINHYKPLVLLYLCAVYEIKSLETGFRILI